MAELELGIMQLLRWGWGSKIGSRFESPVCGLEIVTAPVEIPQNRIGRGRFRVYFQRRIKFGFGSRLILLRQSKDTERQVISRAVLIFRAHLVEELPRFIKIIQAGGRRGQQHECPFSSRLLLERAQGCLSRLLNLTRRQEGLPKLELEFASSGCASRLSRLPDRAAAIGPARSR